LNRDGGRAVTRAALLAFVIGTVSTAGTTTAQSQEDAPSNTDFENAIAMLDKLDPRAPAALAGRLEYADFLAGAATGDCRERLAAAQTLLDSITVNAVLEVALPNGLARAANIEYRIHLTRASCSGAPDRESELRAALTAVQRAVELYRDALDYQSMAIAQFNAAAAYRLLGDAAAAAAALEAAVGMDREFGFHQDALENANLLRRWKRGDAHDTDPTAGDVQDFPSRSATLNFGWTAGDADIGTRMDYSRVAAQKLHRASGAASVKRRIQARHRGWAVVNEPSMIANDADVTPDGAADLDTLAIIFTRALRQHPDIDVSAQGDLRDVIDSRKFGRLLAAGAKALIRDRTPAGEAASRLTHHVAAEIDTAFAPEVIETKAAEEYSLETGAWIGATLEQGVWYKMTAALSLPGVEQLFLSHDMEFAYTRNLPCTAGSTVPSCVELVIHATPQENLLEELIQGLAGPPRLRHGQTVHYWSASYLRIVTDPATLRIYVSDARRYWYLSNGDVDPQGTENVSERVVSTFAYH
jgi:tetratricopeptide (TPR) repeat protein